MTTKQTELTQEQIKRVWGWCKLHYTEPYWVDENNNLAFYGETYSELLESVNLNNLDKFALHKLWICDIKLEEGIFWFVKVAHPDFGEGKADDENLAMAVFWAVWRMIGG